MDTSCNCPIRRWAAEAPQAPALVTVSQTWTYRDLLAEIEGRTQGPLIVEATNSPESIMQLAGAALAGRSVVPLNPAMPPAARDAVTATLQAEAPLGPSVLVLTSGSAGAPKTAILPLPALLENARRSNANIPVAPGDRWLLSLPLFHVSGLGVLLRSWLGCGAVAVPGHRQPMAEAMAELRPTHVSLVATQLRRALADPGQVEQLRGMKAILLGGSAIPEALVREAHACGLPICKSYGLTEMGSQVTTTRPGATVDELLTAGTPLAPDSIRLAKDGEIEVTGATRFSGYLGQPPLAPGAWFPTRDLGRWDAAGRLIVLGRKDNMFISGGENIHPEEIERALAGLPGVQQAVVVPVPDPEFVQAGFAFVEMGEGLPLEPGAIRAGLRECLPPYKVPRHIHPWPTDLAQPGLKPSRPALRARAAEIISSA